MLASRIRPIGNPEIIGTVAGRALTLETVAGDNATIHEVIAQITPGDILVIDAKNYPDRAVMGELIVGRLRVRGCKAIIIDGAIRDSQAIRGMNFPVYGASVSPAGPYRNGPGKIGEPVTVGGVVVHTGDYVIADADGITIVQSDNVEDVLSKAEAKDQSEAAERQKIFAELKSDSLTFEQFWGFTTDSSK